MDELFRYTTYWKETAETEWTVTLHYALKNGIPVCVGVSIMPIDPAKPLVLRAETIKRMPLHRLIRSGLPSMKKLFNDYKEQDET